MQAARTGIKQKGISAQTATAALTRLGELLSKENLHVELVCCGGIISMFYFNSRQATHDIDAIFPKDPKVADKIKTLIDQVGEEFGLETGESPWMNDSVKFFGLETKSNVSIFSHAGLEMKAAKWEELLAHKIHAFRSQTDIDDAMHILGEIIERNKEAIWADVKRYAPFVPHIAEEVRRSRFEQIYAATVERQAQPSEVLGA